MLHGLHSRQPLLVVVPSAQICQDISPEDSWIICREHLSSLSRKSRVSGDTKCWFSLCTNLKTNYILLNPNCEGNYVQTSPISFYCVCRGCLRIGGRAQFGICQGTRTAPLFQAPFQQFNFFCEFQILTGQVYSTFAILTSWS